MVISWFLFTRISVPKIDRQMAEDKKPRACPVDIFGARALFIANAISLPLNISLNPIIDINSVQSYANRFDKSVAIILSISTYLFALSGIAGYFFLSNK